MRGFSSICAVLAALLSASGACAADPSPDQARIRAVVTGLRQSLSDTGLSQALTRASDWVRELEVSWTAHLNGHAAGGINTDADTDIAAAAATAAAAAEHVAFTSHPASLDLGLVSFGTSGSDDRVWDLGHAQPLASLIMGGRTEHNGSTTRERALTSHDLELGLRMPMMPWNATIAGDHYWWGMRGFGPQVEGTRVTLKLRPIPNVEITGGRASDTRGSSGFVGLRYSVPLDQPK